MHACLFAMFLEPRAWCVTRDRNREEPIDYKSCRQMLQQIPADSNVLRNLLFIIQSGGADRAPTPAVVLELALLDEPSTLERQRGLANWRVHS